MALKRIDTGNASLSALLDKAREEPLIVESESNGQFAIMPLDDDVIDLLLERNPKLIKECQEIQQRMKQGHYLTHQEVVEELARSDSARR